MLKLNRNSFAAVGALAAGMFAASANAAIDVTTVTSGITDATTAVGTIGAAVVLVVLGIKAYKWVRSSL